MSTSTSTPVTKLLTGAIDIPRALLNVPSVEVSDEEAAAALENALEASGGILALEREYWYCRPLNAIITFKFRFNARKSDSYFYDNDQIVKIFENYTAMIAQEYQQLRAVPLSKAEALFIIKHFSSSGKQKMVLAFQNQSSPEWYYSFLKDEANVSTSYFGTDNFDSVKVCILPKFPLGLKNDGKEIGNVLEAFKQHHLYPKEPKLNLLFHALMGTKAEDEATAGRTCRSPFDTLKNTLLHCDETRFALDAYDEKLLTDDGRGHWDLWDMDNQNDKTSQVTIPDGQWLVARNPEADVLKGVVAIDFGTKSTVVVRLEESGISQPMRVGLGNLRKAVEGRDFENPTVMEFNDWQGFFDAYRNGEGRPNTEWRQVTISHTAANALLESAAEDYHAYIAELKQWAGDKARTLCVMDKEKNRLELPAYIDLQEDNLDPIEIYAYYLGLNINNMIQRITLDYILSFPVTYDKVVQKRIMESFKRGLRKSLPGALLRNEEVMQHFSVSAGASEPAAYAICAMKQFGFEPQGSEGTAFAVFDFGGGTTDFDFGIWRAADEKTERRFDYAIEHYGAGGDNRLGGENILERLAYETFVKNEDVMREKSIVLQCPSGCTPPPGFEYLLNQSQEAGLNMRCLMKSLRPLWERHEGYEETFDSGKLKVDLFNESGDKLPGLELEVSREELEEVIRQLIKAGVDQFFFKMEQIFGQSELLKRCSDGIQIFLAGNSCKSPVVWDIFEERIQKETERVKKLDPNANVDELYHLFPPLGTDEAKEIQKARDCDIDSSPNAPTGKTGVAFGLIDCRRGSRVKIIDHSVRSGEIAFKYFAGYARRDCLKPLLSPNSKYNEWVKLYEADEDIFEIYYSTLAEAASGRLKIQSAGVHFQRISITPQPDGVIFLRAVSPSVIEYMIANEGKEGQPGKKVMVQPTTVNLEK